MFEDMLSRPLTVGLILDDGKVRVHPPIERALRSVVEKLERHGHEVISWNTSGHSDIINVQVRLLSTSTAVTYTHILTVKDQYYSADGGEDIIRDVSVCNEPYIPAVKKLIESEAISVYEYWQLNRQKVKFQKMYLDRWNNARGPSGRQVDALLSPVAAHPAVPYDSFR